MIEDILVIYEDPDVVVIDKPAGLLVIPAEKAKNNPTVVDWVRANYSIWPQDDPRPGIVHRLDRDTSGLLIIAKHKLALEFLRAAFRERRVEKLYHAIVHGVIRADEGLIDTPIGRSANDPRRRVAHRGAVGRLRSALTNWRVLERFPGHTYVALVPKTGRTHQLRVHLKSLGYPIVGDKLYAPSLPDLLPQNRQLLHALRLELTLPSGVYSVFRSTLPTDFAAALAYLSKL